MDQTSIKHLLYVGGNGMVNAFDCSGPHPQILWTADLGMRSGFVTTLGHLNHVYVGCGGHVYQLDGKTGNVNWTKKLSRGLFANITLVLNGSFLIAGVLGYVSALDKDAGHLLWEANLEGAGYKPVSLLLRPGQVIAGSCGRVYCFDALNGKLIWENGLSGAGLQGVSLSFNHVLYVGCRGCIYSLSPTDGTLIGYNSLPDTGYDVVSQLWVGQHLLVSTGTCLRKLDASGNELWRNNWTDYEFSGHPCMNMQLVDEQLYIGYGCDILHVDLDTGALASVWKLTAPFTINHAFLNFVHLGDFFYVNTRGHFYQVDRITGGVVWENDLKGFGYAAHLLATHDQHQDFNRGNLFVFEKSWEERESGLLAFLLY